MIESRIEKNIYIGVIPAGLTPEEARTIIDEALELKVVAVVLDMYRFGSLDKTMLTLFMSLHQGLQEFGIPLCMTGLSQTNDRILRVAELDKKVLVFPHVEHAIYSLSGSKR